MKHILVVENSSFFGSVIANRLRSDLGYQAIWVKTLAETESVLEKGENSYFLALVDFVLPDAPDGQIIDVVLSHNVLPIVMTTELNDRSRDRIWSKKVVDYVIKEGPFAVEYLISLVKRISTNHQMKVLVVDDSSVSRKHIGDLLAIQRYQTIFASDGVSCLKILDDQPDIQMMIVDYNMPGMQGDELTKRVRRKFPRERLAIIGISTFGSGYLSARFLKNGANDFLYKPFLTEELYCRLADNATALKQYITLSDSANRDYLTGLYNRRYFYAVGQKMFANAVRKNIRISVAMIDADFFKKVNDTYGHDAGDEVLRHIATVLAKRFRASDVVARMGGEEFCVLTANMASEHVFRIFDEVRQGIEDMVIQSGGTELKVTVSIGVCVEHGETLDAMIARSDQMLYEAKKRGRNRVVLDYELDKNESRLRQKAS